MAAPRSVTASTSYLLTLALLIQVLNSETSTPIAFRPSSLAWTRVVPDPQKGSRTASQGLNQLSDLKASVWSSRKYSTSCGMNLPL